MESRNFGWAGSLAVLLLATPMWGANKYTLNKTAYPGNVAFSNLQTLSTTASPISAWSIGVPLVYAITIDNSDPSQTSPVDITLKEVLDSQFEVLAVSCSAFGSTASCPTTVPQDGSPVSGIKIALGDRIVILVTGYYKSVGDFQNKFSVCETLIPANEEQGPTKVVTIQGSWPMLDLGIKKSASTTSTALPATVRYTLTITADANNDFYVGGLLKIRDFLTANFPPSISYAISGYTCTTTLGSTCPGAPTPVSSNNPSLTWPSGTGVILKKGDTLVLSFDVKISTAETCGDASVILGNWARLETNGFVFTDANAGVPNPNSTQNTSNQFSTGLSACILPGTVTKKRVCSSTPCPPVNWGGTVTYAITVTNTTAASQNFQVSDNISKPSITVPLKITLVTPVTCTPGTVVCTTSSSSPVNLINDFQNYPLFQTSFTLAGGASVVLTFDVKIDKLADCATDTKNALTNTAYLHVSTGSPAVLKYVNDSSIGVDLPELPLCGIKVTKTLKQPAAGPIVFGQPVSFEIAYENWATSPIVVHTLRDTLNLIGAANYGSIPIQAGSLAVSCTSTTGVTPIPSTNLGLTAVNQSSPGWAGTTVIQEPNSVTGITFPAKTGTTPSSVNCTVTFVPLAPSTTDNLCQGQGSPQLVNNAFADVSGLSYQFYATKPSAPAFDSKAVDLLLCRKVTVLKSPLGDPSTGPNGTLTFQIKVTNDGNDPVANFELNDPVPPGFSINSGSVSCAPALCSTIGVTGSNTVLDILFAPIPEKSSVTITFTVTAPVAGGTYFNTTKGSFTAGSNFYFEGDPSVLLVNSAQVQVLTPLLSKKFSPANIAVNGTSVLTFTITNVNSDPAQTGIAFTDLLPSGVSISSAPTTACGGTLTASGQSITLANASLPKGVHSCQFTVKVTATACGVYVNDKTKFPFEGIRNLDVTQATDSLTVTGCPPVVTVKKQIKGEQISIAGPFTFSIVCTGPSGSIQKTVTVNLPSNAIFSGIPAGSKCKVTELMPLPTLPDGYMWSGLPSYSPANGNVVVGENGAQLTVTNVIRKCLDRGQIKIIKRVDGVPPGFQGTFSFLVTCLSGNQTFSYTASISYPGSSSTLIENVPSGSSCTVQEVGPLPALGGLYQWQAPQYSPASGQVSLVGNCCPEVTVINTAKYCCETKGGGTSEGGGSGTGANIGTPRTATRPKPPGGR